MTSRDPEGEGRDPKMFGAQYLKNGWRYRLGWQWSAYRKWIHVNPVLRRPCWYTNVGMAWLRHTCQHTASQRHHSVVGITCALLSPVNSLFHVRGQTTETTVLPFTGQSWGTVQPISVCWTFHCQCSGNDWKFPVLGLLLLCNGRLDAFAA